jgi:EamA domain-containing membrane protein RarD
MIFMIETVAENHKGQEYDVLKLRVLWSFVFISVVTNMQSQIEKFRV